MDVYFLDLVMGKKGMVNPDMEMWGIYLEKIIMKKVRYHLSIYLSVHTSIHSSIYPSIHPSIYLSIYLYIYPSILLSIHLSIHLSIYLLSTHSSILSTYMYVIYLYEIDIYLLFGGNHNNIIIDYNSCTMISSLDHKCVVLN